MHAFTNEELEDDLDLVSSVLDMGTTAAVVLAQLEEEVDLVPSV